jgi:putative transposase
MPDLALADTDFPPGDFDFAGARVAHNKSGCEIITMMKTTEPRHGNDFAVRVGVVPCLPAGGCAVPRQNSDQLSNQVHRQSIQFGLFTCKTGPMLRPLRLLVVLSSRSLRSRRDLLLENLALRQQLGVLKRRRPQPRFAVSDKLFWVILRRLWPRWQRALILVQPETVVGWHRAGFKLYWTWLSRHRKRAGRKCVNKELREVIFRMIAENRTWGAPRIHGELKMLGFDISERTVLRWMRKAPRNPEPAKRWAAFLRNHREAIAAMDFFTVPTLTFGVLYCFFVIAHDRRRILHFNVTTHPTSAWVSQQLREAFPFDAAPRYLIHDRDATFSAEVLTTAKILGLKSIRTSFKSPWQNGVAERFVGNCRRDLLDHVIVLNERHLKRLMNEYVRYYHDDRTHLALAKGTPVGREAASKSGTGGRVIAMPRLGGLHHRYDLAA